MGPHFILFMLRSEHNAWSVERLYVGEGFLDEELSNGSLVQEWRVGLKGNA